MTAQHTRKPLPPHHTEQLIIALLVCVFCGCTPSMDALSEAAKTGDIATLKRGEAFFRKNPNDAQLALKTAIRHQQLDSARWLLDLKVKPRFIMHLAAEAHIKDPTSTPWVRQTSMATLLLDHGATGQAYLLPNAIRSKDVVMAKAILNHRSIKETLRNKSPQDRKTFLYHVATRVANSVPVQNNDKPMLKLLLKHGLEPNHAVLTAVREGNIMMLDVLLEDKALHQLAITMVMHEKTIKQRARLLEHLRKKGINHPRALTVVASTGDIDSAKVLLHHGAKDLQTALLNAKKFKHQAMITLIQGRINTTTKDIKAR